MNTTHSVLGPMQKNMHAINMNGLKGRMLKVSSSKYPKSHIMLVYGHHASLERVYGIAEALSDYGTVTVPDIPGCGGMESFYSIGMKPTLDAMADYLASFIKLKYRGKKVAIMGMSLGFVIVTRMLQRYPTLVDRVDILVSFVGFTHSYDLSFSPVRKLAYRAGAGLFARKLPSMLFYNIALHPTVIRTVYSKTFNAKKKLSGLSVQDKKTALDFEVTLWRDNDVRTYMEMAIVIFTVDNCTVQIDLPVHHVSVDKDQYFDNSVVEQHMRVIFTNFIEHPAIMPTHAPSILASKKDAAPFVPKSIARLLIKRAKA
jgi:pimeloyl-ACP methyl ester carboxylesterase